MVKRERSLNNEVKGEGEGEIFIVGDRDEGKVES